MNGNDPKNYRKVSEPFENVEKADQATKTFYEMVYDLRNEAKITDVHIITRISIDIDGEEKTCISSAHFGNSVYARQMCAWGLRKSMEESDQMVKDILDTDTLGAINE